jgi:large subunit ribosomal protein L14e
VKQLPEIIRTWRVLMFETGRLCVKTAGREAGKYCVIVKKIDSKFVLITGPKELTKVKRRKCNIAHLEPLPHKIKLTDDASDADVLKAYATEGIYEKLGLKPAKPAKEEIKEEIKQEKKAAKKAKETKTKRKVSKEAK